MSEKHKKVSRALNYFEHFLLFTSVVSGCVSISAFDSLVGIHVGIISSAVGINICAITAGIKKYKLLIKKKRKKHDHLVLLAKTKLNIIAVLISKDLSDSYINYDKFVSVDNALIKERKMKEEIKNPENVVEYSI